MWRILVIISIAFWVTSCNAGGEERSKVIQFYKYSNPKIITPEETYITYEYMAKLTNPYKEPIVVPFIQYHQLPIEQGFGCEVKDDSLINIAGYGTGDYFYFGIDTLFPGETQRNYVLLPEYYKRKRRSPYNIISFEYYFLKDFVKTPWSSDVKQHEFFILFEDSLQNVHIYPTNKGFNPYIHHSHPLPK